MSILSDATLFESASSRLGVPWVWAREIGIQATGESC